MDFSELPEFARELKRLQKKYRSLGEDFETLKPYLATTPEGNDSKHWNCLHRREGVAIYKVRLTCAYLRADKMRIIYAHYGEPLRIVFIELYYKGDKENEDRDRIKQYLAGKF